jgi:hypothetical protein
MTLHVLIAIGQQAQPAFEQPKKLNRSKISLVESGGWGFACPPSLAGFMPQPGTWPIHLPP